MLIPLGCASTDEPAPPLDLVGLSSNRPEEAQLAFAKARLLWYGNHRIRHTTPDVCRNPREAITLLTEAINLSPDFDEALAYRALAYKDTQQLKNALTDINAAIKLRQTAPYYAYRALILIHQQRFEEAQTDVNNARSLDNSLPLVWKYQGQLYLHQDQTEKACENFEKACSYGDCSGIEKARLDGICLTDD